MTEKRPNRTLGPQHDEFWAWCGKNELRLQRCGSCGQHAWPVVAACDTCGGESFTWDRMSGRGKVASRCTFDYDYYNGLMQPPYDVLLVELDEGVLFVANPVGFNGETAAMDAPVKLTWIDCEDAAGAFRLPAFAPA